MWVVGLDWFGFDLRVVVLVCLLEGLVGLVCGLWVVDCGCGFDLMRLVILLMWFDEGLVCYSFGLFGFALIWNCGLLWAGGCLSFGFGLSGFGQLFVFGELL